MLVTRWQAPIVPQVSQILKMYEAEGLEPTEERFAANSEVAEQRHPFDEVITVAEGELMLDITGNKLLLRPGDRIVIPSNTKYQFKAGETNGCMCIRASKTF